MDLDRELAAVFLEEARAKLAVLEDDAAKDGERAEAAHGLASAAGLVGLGGVKAAAEEAERSLRQGGAAAPSVIRIAQLLHALTAEVAAEARLAPAPGRRANMILDADEAEQLRGIFRAEAQEHLEGLTAALLELEKERGRRSLIDEVLRKTHTLKGSAATVGLFPVSEAAHQLEEVFAQIRGGRLPLADAVFDPLVAAVDALRAIVDASERPDLVAPLAERLRAELARASRREEPAAPTPVVEPPTGPIASAGESRRDEQTLRVDAARIDGLMDAVGELVFDKTRIERRAQELRAVVRELGKTRSSLRALLAGSAPPRLAEIEADLAHEVARLARAADALLDDTEALRRTTTTLQTGLTHVRMTPVRWLFSRLARPLRDLTRREGKRVELFTSGESTELDKAVVEKISDPLIQLIRNALAHGIEPLEVRAQRGKSPVGRISVAARTQGDTVFLEVADDGGGIDAGKVRASLVASGRMSQREAEAASDERVMKAIFEPGVSTREAADELAGHGVGLDVVRESIARLGGDINVSSTPAVGTRFTIRLPFTTAVAQAVLFKVGGQIYALPGVHVVDTAAVESSAPELPGELRLKDQVVPLVSLHRLLGVELKDARRVPVLVLEFAGRRLAATCDKVVGPREIVVKSLGPLLAPLGLYAGGTISGAGKVQLILDPAALVQVAYPAPAPSPSSSTAPASGPHVAADSGSFPAVSSAPPEGGPHRRLLIADDSRPVRESLSRMLAAEGFVVDLAHDGWEAWEMLHEVRYDLVVTDLEMPRLSGFQLIEKMKQSHRLAALPVVVISAATASPQRERARAAGADAYLAKPISRKEIARRVGELLARHHS